MSIVEVHESNFSFPCLFSLSLGGVSLCTQHRGPWNILYRLLRVSVSLMTLGCNFTHAPPALPMTTLD